MPAFVDRVFVKTSQTGNNEARAKYHICLKAQWFNLGSTQNMIIRLSFHSVTPLVVVRNIDGPL